MHAVNNGPIKADKVEQSRGNFDDFEAAKIPFARTHDGEWMMEESKVSVINGRVKLIMRQNSFILLENI